MLKTYMVHNLRNFHKWLIKDVPEIIQSRIVKLWFQYLSIYCISISGTFLYTGRSDKQHFSCRKPAKFLCYSLQLDLYITQRMVDFDGRLHPEEVFKLTQDCFIMFKGIGPYQGGLQSDLVKDKSRYVLLKAQVVDGKKEKKIILTQIHRVHSVLFYT